MAAVRVTMTDMPPRSSRPPPPPGAGARRARRGSGSLDAAAIEAALAPVVPDGRDLRFVLRCILEEGPRHHRVASWALLQMLAAVIAELDAPSAVDPAGSEASPVPIRLPPAVARSADDSEFPIGVPRRLLERILSREDAATAVDALSDGPPHHALANAAMAWLLEAIYERVQRGRPAE